VPADQAARFSPRRLASLAIFATAGVLFACQTAGVDRAYMALDENGARKRTQFFTDTQSIWCDVEYSSGRMDLTIDAVVRATQLWNDERMANVPVDVEVARGETVGKQGANNVESFEWLPGGQSEQTVPFPVGDFVCDLTLDGQSVASLPFTIDFPPCPVDIVTGGAPCAGWVREGSVCPGALGSPCTCTGGVWSC